VEHPQGGVLPADKGFDPVDRAGAPCPTWVGSAERAIGSRWPPSLVEKNQTVPTVGVLFGSVGRQPGLQAFAWYMATSAQRRSSPRRILRVYDHQTDAGTDANGRAVYHARLDRSETHRER